MKKEYLNIIEIGPKDLDMHSMKISKVPCWEACKYVAKIIVWNYLPLLVLYIDESVGVFKDEVDLDATVEAETKS